jgi:prepilin-type processing-associated H-X9-DG protein
MPSIVSFTRPATLFTPMKRRIRNNRAFTLLELLAIFGVLFLLFALVMAALVKAHAKTQRISCVNNLKNVGLAFRLTSADTGKSFLPTNSVPKSFDDLIAHWKSLTNEFPLGAWMTCPADDRKRSPELSLARTNASYFVGLNDGMPQDILMGDRNITTNSVCVGSGIFRIHPNSVVAWDGRMHRFQGNVAMGDGSVQQANTKSFRSSDSNLLAMP